MSATMTVAVLGLGIAASGCGGDDGGSTSSTAGGSADAAFQPVKAPPTTPPDGILLTKPLSKRPPAGKTIGYVSGSLPLNAYYAESLKSAVKPLGWKVKTFFSNDPAAGMTQAVNSKVDYVWVWSPSKSTIATPVAAAEKAGIPVLNFGNPTDKSDPAAGYFTTAQNNVVQARNMADWIINDSKGKANVGLFTIRALAYFDPAEKTMKQEFAKQCAGCKFDVTDITLNDVSTSAIPAKAVSYLQSHPDVDYLTFAYGDMMINVANTLKSTNLLDKVKLTSVDSVTKALLKEIANGDVAASGVYPNTPLAWWVTDIFATMSVGDDPTEALRNQPGVASVPAEPWIVAGPEAAKATPSDAYGWNGPKGFEQAFQKLWSGTGTR
jgi:ABC-type sugar transport system substrate-binding protein